MEKFLIGLIVGSLIGGIWVQYLFRITGDILHNDTIQEAEQRGWQKCYDHRQNYPYFSPEESKQK